MKQNLFLEFRQQQQDWFIHCLGVQKRPIFFSVHLSCCCFWFFFFFILNTIKIQLSERNNTTATNNNDDNQFQSIPEKFNSILLLFFVCIEIKRTEKPRTKKELIWKNFLLLFFQSMFSVLWNKKTEKKKKSFLVHHFFRYECRAIDLQKKRMREWKFQILFCS